MVRIVTTMTVIPTREHSLIRSIMSVKNGTMQPAAMYVNIPNRYVRFEEPLAPWLKPVLRSIGVQVNEIEHDRCCLNKILPTLEYEKDPETLIVTMDDDMEYSPLYIAGLYEGWKTFGGCVGYSGLAYPERVRDEMRMNPLNYVVQMGHGRVADFLEDGFGTMFKLGETKGFPDLPPLTPGADPTLYLSDDYLWGRFFDYKKVSKQVICWDQIGRFHDDWTSICKMAEDTKKHELSEERSSLADFMKTGEIIRNLWGWF
jgi:hypothetical protein